MATEVQFDWTDRSLFIVMIVSGLAIVFYFASKKSSSLADYVWGGGKLGILPLSMSIIATSISCISFSASSDIYQYGPHVTLDFIGIIIMAAACWTQIPVLYPLKLASLNDYTELRFDSTLKILVSINTLISMAIYATIIAYSSALFISQIVGFEHKTCYNLIVVACYFISSIGGFKGVVWSDAFQAAVILVSTVVLTVFGVREAGGIGTVFRDALNSDRLSYDWSFDLTKRQTVWTSLIGTIAQRTAMHSLFSPGLYQRYAAHQTPNQAYKTVIIQTLGMLIIASLTYFLGYVMYSTFKYCDPVLSGQVKKYDQILPFFIQLIGRNATIARSIYIVGFISAAISTLTTVMNTLAITLYKDFLHRGFNKENASVRGKRLIQLVGLVVVLICVILGQLIQNMGNIVDLTTLLLVPSLFQSSVLFIGIFIPWIGSKGTMWGCLSGSLFTAWISIGHKTAVASGLIKYETKTMSIEQCTNVTLVQKDITAIQEEDTLFLFKVTPFFHPAIWCSMTLFVTLVVTWLTGINDLKVLDRKLVSPLVHRFLPKNNDSDTPLQTRVDGEKANRTSTGV